MTEDLPKWTPPSPNSGLACWVRDLLITDDFYAIGWCDLLGLNKEPTSIEAWLQTVHADDRNLVKATIDEASVAASSFQLENQDSQTNDKVSQSRTSSTQAFLIEYRAATAGEFRWVTLRGQYTLGKNNTPSRIIVTCFDTTMIRSLQTESLGTAPVESIAQAAPILIWTTNSKGRCEWFNERWLEFTGNTLESALVAGRCGCAHPEDREPAVDAFKAAFDLRDSIELEYRLRHHDGQYRWVLDRSSPRFEKNGGFVGYVGICLDVTHEYEYRQRLAEREQVLGRLHDINERERMFLSCAIHDGILQDIIGVDMLLQHAEQLQPDKLEERIGLAHKTLRSAIRHGRRLISELRPMILDEQGLVGAIEFYAAELQNRGTLQVEVTNDFADEVLCPFWSGNVFRIVQSAMDNVESHSKSSSASVAISQGPEGQCCVVVADKGIGFDVEAGRDSFGLRCMRERAELFGGTVEIASELGKGSRVKIVLPMPEVPA